MNRDKWYPLSFSRWAQGKLIYEQRNMFWTIVIPVSGGTTTNAIGYLCLRLNPVSAHRSFEIYFLHGIVYFHFTDICLGLGKIYSEEIKIGWHREEYNCLLFLSLSLLKHFPTRSRRREIQLSGRKHKVCRRKVNLLYFKKKYKSLSKIQIQNLKKDNAVENSLEKSSQYNGWRRWWRTLAIKSQHQQTAKIKAVWKIDFTKYTVRTNYWDGSIGTMSVLLEGI